MKMLYRCKGVISGVRYDFVGTFGGKIGYRNSIIPIIKYLTFQHPCKYYTTSEPIKNNPID